jgi:hypothetical protein
LLHPRLIELFEDGVGNEDVPFPVLVQVVSVDLVDLVSRVVLVFLKTLELP